MILNSADAVDGGKDYLRRCGNRDDWEECSIFEGIDELDNSLLIGKK